MLDYHIFKRYRVEIDGTIYGRGGKILQTKLKGKPASLYLHVRLDVGWVGVAKIVCIAFHSNSHFEGAIVCHKDDNKLNNHADNLYWGTPKTNAEDRKRNGHQHYPKNELHPGVKLSDAEVSEIRDKSNQGFTGVFLASQYGVSTGQISKIVNGKCRNA